MTGLNHVKDTILRLTARKGVPLWFYSVVGNDFNPATGQADRQYTVIQIKKVLALPIDLSRNFDYDLSFIAANKNFTFGAYFDKGAFVCVIEYKKMQGIVPTLNDFAIIGQDQFEVKRVSPYPDQQIYVIGFEGVSNKKPYKFVYARSEVHVEVSSDGNG